MHSTRFLFSIKTSKPCRAHPKQGNAGHVHRQVRGLKRTGKLVHLRKQFLAAGQEHCVVRLRTNHNVPDCRSNSYIKGVAGGTAVGEFCGLVYVAPDAQRTDAQQQNRNILLSETARITTQPQLEIYADDVKCSHGATVDKWIPRRSSICGSAA